MKIAIISTAHGEGRGAEVVLENLLQGWGGERDELMIVAPATSGVARAAAACGFRVRELDTPRDAIRYNLRAIRDLLGGLEDRGLVHAWHSRSFELAWWLGRRLGVPVTGTMHDHPRCSTHSVPRRLLVRWTANHLCGMACVSAAIAEAWEALPVRCPTAVLHNGLVDAPVPRLPSERVRVGFLGMYNPWKGFEVVERWARESRGGALRWQLYGQVSPTLRDRANQLGSELQEDVALRGEQRTEDIYSEIDILVHASTEPDPFPTVLLEAARAGVPAVACALGGAPEIVENRRTGYLFEASAPGEGLRRVLSLASDPVRREAMGAQARRRYLERFHVSTMVKGYEDFWSAAGSGFAT